MLENRMPYQVTARNGTKEVWIIRGLERLEPDPLSQVTDWVEVRNAHLCILKGKGLFPVVGHWGERPYAKVLGIFPNLESAEAFLELQVGS